MHKIISSVPFFYTDSSIFIYFSCCIRQQMRYHRNTISQRVKKRPEPLLSQGFRRPCQGVDATGFEPATSASRTQRSTKLSHTSLFRCLNLLCRSTQDILYYRVSELSTGFLKKFKKIFCWDISDCIVCFVCIIRTTRNML